MPNRNNRNTHSSNRPHAAHSHVQTHHSTPHPMVHHHDEHSTHHRHSNAHHSSRVIRELHRPPRDYRTHPMEFGNRHHDEHLASANRHSNAHHSSPVIRELHRSVRNYSTHPMEIPHPQAKQSFSSRNPLGKLPYYDDLSSKTSDVYPRSKGVSDDIILQKAGNRIGGEIKISIDDGTFQNACALCMSYILQQNGYRISPTDGYAPKGADGLRYLVRVLQIAEFIIKKFGPPTQTLTYLKDGREIRGKTGLLIFYVERWDNAKGHVTLWDGKDCYDHCYFQDNLDEENSTGKVVKVLFWELKRRKR